MESFSISRVISYKRTHPNAFPALSLQMELSSPAQTASSHHMHAASGRIHMKMFQFTKRLSCDRTLSIFRLDHFLRVCIVFFVAIFLFARTVVDDKSVTVKKHTVFLIVDISFALSCESIIHESANVYCAMLLLPFLYELLFFCLNKAYGRFHGILTMEFE